MTKKSYQIFVSHSSKDTRMIDLVTLAFKDRYITPFFARGVMVGKNPVEKIIGAIEPSLALFALMTPNVVSDEHTRDWVVFEIGVAKAKGIPIFCWMDENVAKNRVFPKLVENITDYDTFNSDIEKECFRVVESMLDKAFDTIGVGVKYSKPSRRKLKAGLIQMEKARSLTGNIHINSMTAPSPIVTIKIGDNIRLYFGDVTWSGGQVRLLLSRDGYASLTIPGDVLYGPIFSVADIANTTQPYKQITEGDLRYTVGNNWIEGTIPEALDIPGGRYYVKAFDGSIGAVAVTDNYLKIKATFIVEPDFGPGQAELTLKGYALPANDYANLSYDGNTIKDLVPTDDLGRFVYTMLAPDVMMNNDAGKVSEACDAIVFAMKVKSTGQTEIDTFDEYRRGIVQVKGKTGEMTTSGYLFGSGSDFSTPGPGLTRVDVDVRGDLMIIGKWFHPGKLTILWDDTTILGTTVANSTHGWFNTTVLVPRTAKGEHKVTIDDGKTVFWFLINVISIG